MHLASRHAGVMASLSETMVSWC